jgi:hypothetical protein
VSAAAGALPGHGAGSRCYNHGSAAAAFVRLGPNIINRPPFSVPFSSPGNLLAVPKFLLTPSNDCFSLDWEFVFQFCKLQQPTSMGKATQRRDVLKKEDETNGLAYFVV